MALLLSLPCGGCARSAGRAPERLQFNVRTLPSLPVGLGGAYSGPAGDRLIVAGGTFFSKPPHLGGTKEWDNRVFALSDGAEAWEVVARLAPPLAYGTSIATPRGLVLAGGADAHRHYDTVRMLTLANGRVGLESMPPLPGPVAYLEGARLGHTIYVAGGRSAPDSPQALRIFLALNLDRPGDGWRELEPWPGPARIFPRVVAQDDAIYIFSGAELVPDKDGVPTRRYLTDGYRYRPGQGWTRIADLPHAVVAAPAAAWDNDRILVFGGDDGRLAAQGASLGDKHPGFRREILSYDTKADRWGVVQELPSLTVTTPASVRGRAIFIPTGEDRPGHRTTAVKALEPTANVQAGQR